MYNSAKDLAEEPFKRKKFVLECREYSVDFRFLLESVIEVFGVSILKVLKIKFFEIISEFEEITLQIMLDYHFNYY